MNVKDCGKYVFLADLKELNTFDDDNDGVIVHPISAMYLKLLIWALGGSLGIYSLVYGLMALIHHGRF